MSKGFGFSGAQKPCNAADQLVKSWLTWIDSARVLHDRGTHIHIRNKHRKLTSMNMYIKHNMYICACIYIYVYIYVYIKDRCVCVFTCMCLCVFECICVHTCI